MRLSCDSALVHLDGLEVLLERMTQQHIRSLLEGVVHQTAQVVGLLVGVERGMGLLVVAAAAHQTAHLMSL